MDGLGSILDMLFGFSATKAEELNTLQVCLRAVIVFFLLLGYVRFGKKRFLGQATALDAILVIVIGSVASRAISGTAPFVPSMAAAFMLVAVHWLLTYFTQSSRALGNIVKGYDTLLIKNGRVDRKALRDAHMSDDDLAEDLRQQGVASASDVKEARLERNGRLSVIKN
jgi:uncharacterized membrane protein YcaP (DUF421 family)